MRSLTQAATTLILVLGFATGCQNKQTKYDDPKKQENINIDYGRTDLKKVVDSLVQQFLDSDPATWDDPPAGAVPLITVGKLKNRTQEHINTRTILNKLRTALLRSKKYRFTLEDRNMKKNLADVEFQQDSGLYEQNGKSAKTGNWLPPEYRLHGEIFQKKKENDDVKDSYLYFVLSLEKINNAVTAWSVEKEIVKVSKRATVGW